MSHNPLVRPFSAFIGAREDYLLTLDTEGKSPETIARVRAALKKFAILLGELDPAAIDANTLRRFVRAMKDGGSSSRTQKNYLADMKTWLSWLSDEGGYGVEAAAFARARPPRVVQEPIVPFTKEQLQAMIEAADKGTWWGERLRTMIVLLVDTGIRNQEICGLQLGDMDLTDGAITIRPITDKTRKGRTIGLGRDARVALGRYYLRWRNLPSLPLNADSPFFLGKRHDPLARNSLDQIFRRLGQRAGVADVHPHRFRHTMAILALRGGMNPFTLMHTLGHTDLTMTKRYMRIVDTDVSPDKRAKSPGDALKLKL